MRKPLIAGNWKMNASRAMVESLLTQLKRGLRSGEEYETVVFPPFIYLPQVEALLSGSAIQWGAQNFSEHESGAYTGEIAASMLQDFHCSYVLIGHSERRLYYKETDAVLAKKFQLANKYALKPILCVGETQEQYERDETRSVITQQLEAVISQAGVDLQTAVIAYEPVWAIGTGLTATPEQAQAVHAEIRAVVAAVNADIAQKIRILYGGSVKPSNAQELLAMPDIDGVLVGGASLDADSFLAIHEVFN